MSRLQAESREASLSSDIPAGAVLHLRADAPMATDDDNGVILWPDQSGQANHLVAPPFPRARPVLVPDAANGLPALDFDGSRQRLAGCFLRGFDGDEFTWFVILRADDPAATSCVMGNAYSRGAFFSSKNMWGCWIRDASAMALARARNGTAVTSSLAIDDQLHLHRGQWSAANELTSHLDGSPGPTAIGADAFPRHHLLLRIGAAPFRDNQPFDGQVAEIIVYQGSLPEPDAARVESYLLSKYLRMDSDGDGMPDAWEEEHGLDPNDPADAALDQDSDDLTNLQEYELDLDPNNPDTDNDFMRDGWEISHNLNPNDPADAALDPDEDFLSNLDEHDAGTDPRDPDCDQDQIKDGLEIRDGHDLRHLTSTRI